MEKEILRFEQVTGRGRKFPIQNVNFTMKSGYIYGLTGRNGAGKSTLIKTILHEQSRYKGAIYVDGIPVKENYAAACRKIGYVSEDNVFFEKCTAMQNAEALGVFYDDFQIERFCKQMQAFDVPVSKQYGAMSRGEKLKCQLAFAIAHQPVLYLIDEATAGMDAVFRLQFFDCMRRLVEDESCGVLLTSHITTDLERNTDYSAVMENDSLAGGQRALTGFYGRMTGNRRRYVSNNRRQTTAVFGKIFCERKNMVSRLFRVQICGIYDVFLWHYRLAVSLSGRVGVHS